MRARSPILDTSPKTLGSMGRRSGKGEGLSPAISSLDSDLLLEGEEEVVVVVVKVEEVEEEEGGGGDVVRLLLSAGERTACDMIETDMGGVGEDGEDVPGGGDVVRLLLSVGERTAWDMIETEMGGVGDDGEDVPGGGDESGDEDCGELETDEFRDADRTARRNDPDEMREFM